MRLDDILIESIRVLDRQANSAFVITAYELRGKPLTAYKRRMRRRRK